jgi:uncharacterized YccA/Bax inhibitor family protein
MIAFITQGRKELTMETSNIFGRKENAVLNSQTFMEFAGRKYEKVMTIRGTVNKTATLLIITTASASWVWLSVAHDVGFGGLIPWLVPAALAALLVGLITSANMQAARFTAPLYAFLEGVVLGVLSAIFETQYPGIVIQAVFLTFGTLLSLLVIYYASGFQVTARFRVGVLSATLAIFLIYGVNILLRLLGWEGLPFIHESDFLGICFSLYVAGIAALNLVLDFDLVERGVQEGAPKYMEWYAAFGLMVTLIWLYLEVLDLLMKIAASSDDN